uniref:Uncharacterized protein n=1 Tax=Fagus sylvatica TaxID=28930 RepID=A0A2N9GA00_FAGSY
MDLSFGRGFTEFVKLSPFKSSVASSNDDDEDNDSSLTRMNATGDWLIHESKYIRSCYNRWMGVGNNASTTVGWRNGPPFKTSPSILLRSRMVMVEDLKRLIRRILPTFFLKYCGI